MATRNPANEIEFGKVNFGAPISVFAVAGAAGADAEVAPGMGMERFQEVVAQRGTLIGFGAFNGGSFNVYVENSSWDAAALEAEIQAISYVDDLGATVTPFSLATVADAGL